MNQRFTRQGKSGFVIHCVYCQLLLILIDIAALLRLSCGKLGKKEKKERGKMRESRPALATTARSARLQQVNGWLLWPYTLIVGKKHSKRVRVNGRRNRKNKGKGSE